MSPNPKIIRAFQPAPKACPFASRLKKGLSGLDEYRAPYRPAGTKAHGMS